uniref:hypothetical protein n=1 Tax=Escherichia coli TaxID=562 RepID=UPI001F3CCA30
DDKGWDARKRAYCLKIQPATGSFARNLIYSTKPVRAGALNDYHAGENITIHFDMTKCHFFDAETEIAIR